MKLETVLSKLNDNLENHLDKHTPNHPVREIYKYAVLPAGKLFRPQLVWAIANDFNKSPIDLEENSNHAYLASAVEVHHAYSLVHDDLPCMDDDDMRRGKPSTHKAHGEWQALLAGDGLLNLSYGLISKIDSTALSKVFKFFSWALGPKGLIHGQVLDLAEEMKENFSTLLDTHKLKTARLIQTSMVCSYLLTTDRKFDEHYRAGVDILKLGHYTGIVFQLLDDLTEFADESLSAHEQEISPWYNFPKTTNDELLKGLKKIDEITSRYQTENFNMVMKNYFGKIFKILENGNSNVEKHLSEIKTEKVELAPIMTLLQRLC